MRGITTIVLSSPGTVTSISAAPPDHAFTLIFQANVTINAPALIKPAGGGSSTVGSRAGRRERAGVEEHQDS
jgi:hypothetical protein